MSRLALGTAQFGMSYGIANKQGKINFISATEILAYAYAAGIDTLDTAIAYGDSEQCLGSIGVKSWKVISKLPKMPESTPDILNWVKQKVLGSLTRLQLPKLYGLLLHHPEQLLSIEGKNLYNALMLLKEEELVNKIGVSIYSVNEIELLLSQFELDLVQVPCNILDRNLVESGWLYHLKELGIEIHVRSVFLQGLLLMNTQNRPSKFNHWQALWYQWDEWLKSSNISAIDACLNYVLSFPEISKIVVGIDTLCQFKEILNVKEMNLQVPDFLFCNDPYLIHPSNWNNL
ncbi:MULTISPECIES: aldo/keto reductase [Pseudanabaena]|uniref:Aldo/keto reductase n=2 Tax=Pseudanabaena TaxID=1152 RepID=A0A9X4RHG4_9CYAN|nr:MULTISPECIES: aldo/keto reductase [Pseudanabaena]ELS33348.1 putative oxidoreductase [Pseudanabaena biceps PCC 7429]MDG3494446.1 aldo/keto reductase [Pseudanabaena catenata USMAC16]